VGTTILLKAGKGRYAWVTLTPLAFIVTVTFSAGWQKIFSPDPRLGFLAHADLVTADVARGAADAATAARLVFNDRLDTVMCALFLLVTALAVLGAAASWWRALRRRGPSPGGETPFVETAYAA
jgi:carbon starvation protein